MAQNCHLLSNVEVTNTRVMDAGIEAFAKNCTSLTEIQFECCNQVTDKGVFTLVENCKLLKNQPPAASPTRTRSAQRALEYAAEGAAGDAVDAGLSDLSGLRRLKRPLQW